MLTEQLYKQNLHIQYFETDMQISSLHKFDLNINYNQFRWLVTSLEQAIVVEDQEAKKSSFSSPAQLIVTALR